MFEKLQPQPADALLALIKLFRDDPRADKIDLGVGVFRDESGNTPVFEAVKAAEGTLAGDASHESLSGPGRRPRGSSNSCSPLYSEPISAHA